MFSTVEHCIDALRQALMCNADVSPNSWHINMPISSGVFPRIATTHTCRNFEKVQDWAKKHQVPASFDPLIPKDEIEKILNDPPADQLPWEDLTSVWWKFPGNKFFKEWRDANENLTGGNGA